MAKPIGPAMWTLDTLAPKDTKPRLTKHDIKRRDKALQIEIGAELLAISTFAGRCAALGDAVSVGLLLDYVKDILIGAAGHLGMTLGELEDNDFLQ